MTLLLCALSYSGSGSAQACGRLRHQIRSQARPNNSDFGRSTHVRKSPREPKLLESRQGQKRELSSLRLLKLPHKPRVGLVFGPSSTGTKVTLSSAPSVESLPSTIESLAFINVSPLRRKEWLISGVAALAASISLILAFPSSSSPSRTAAESSATLVGDQAQDHEAAEDHILLATTTDNNSGVMASDSRWSVVMNYGQVLNGGPLLALTSSAAAVQERLCSPWIEARQQEQQQDEMQGIDRPTVSTDWLPSDDRAPYDVSVLAIKGSRVTMEDEYVVANGGRFAAVFDGHGGGGVSQLLKRQLYRLILQYLQQKHWEESDDDDSEPGTVKVLRKQEASDTNISTGSTSKVPSISAHVAAMRSAFEHVDKDAMDDDNLKYQGSTAVAILVHENEEGHRTILSANVGDSRAILSRRGRAVDLTRDHKPNEEREKARILAMGETIEWDRFSKVHRVRNLSLSRAIGDRYAKPVVSGEVEIMHFPVAEDGGDEFFLLASDGLWDVMSSQDVVSFVHRKLEGELSRANIDKDDIENYKLVLRRNMAKFVGREAVRRGSGDNICVLLVWLNDRKSSSAKTTPTSSVQQRL